MLACFNVVFLSPVESTMNLCSLKSSQEEVELHKNLAKVIQNLHFEANKNGKRKPSDVARPATKSNDLITCVITLLRLAVRTFSS